MPVAQLDRVTGYEPVGRGFESLQARQNLREHLSSRFCYIVPIAAFAAVMGIFYAKKQLRSDEHSCLIFML